MKDPITYWTPGVENQFGGPVYGAPLVLVGAWYDRIENVVSPEGQELVSKARCMLKMQVAWKGYLFQGISAASDPTTVNGSQLIRIVTSVPNLSDLSRLYIAYL